MKLGNESMKCGLCKFCMALLDKNIKSCGYCAKINMLVGTQTDKSCNNFEFKNNMEKIDKTIEILQAFKEGKRIEYLFNNEWLGALSIDIILEKLKYGEVRIAKEQTYRPYANAEEFLKDNIKHRGWFKKLCNNNLFFTPYHIDNVKGAIFFKNCKLDCLANFNDLCESYVWADDGTPCGILNDE